MTEKEKCRVGLPYDANDKELLEERLKAKDLCFQFNGLSPLEVEKRNALLKELLEIEGDAEVHSPLWCDYGYNVKIGKHFFSNHGLTILDAAEVRFGDYVFIGPNCGFYTSSHPLDYKERNTGLETAHPISIGDHVWIGANVIILPGVTVGSNVVIGAGSVVTKDIPDGVLAYGNPCRVIRAILKDEKWS